MLPGGGTSWNWVLRNQQESTPRSHKRGRGIPARGNARPEGCILPPIEALIHSFCSKHSDAPREASAELQPRPHVPLLVRARSTGGAGHVYELREVQNPFRRKWEEGSGTYLGTRTTYSVTFWLPGPCGQRRRDGECGAAEAAAGTPPTPPHTHEGRHGRRRSVVRVRSGPVRVPQSRGSRSRGAGSLAPTEDPKAEVPPILGATTGKPRSLGRLGDHSGHVCACA